MILPADATKAYQSALRGATVCVTGGAGFIGSSTARQLLEQGHEVADLGPETADRVDYPDFGYKLADVIADGTAEYGVALCGSGIGFSVQPRHVDQLPAVLASAAFGSICGSSVATAATITGVALPEMKRHGYSGRLSTGTLAAGGDVAPAEVADHTDAG